MIGMCSGMAELEALYKPSESQVSGLESCTIQSPTLSQDGHGASCMWYVLGLKMSILLTMHMAQPTCHD
jgi:hypothetical protein